MRPSASSQLTQFLKMSLSAGVGGAWWRIRATGFARWFTVGCGAPQEQAVSAWGLSEKEERSWAKQLLAIKVVRDCLSMEWWLQVIRPSQLTILLVVWAAVTAPCMCYPDLLRHKMCGSLNCQEGLSQVLPCLVHGTPVPSKDTGCGFCYGFNYCQ